MNLFSVFISITSLIAGVWLFFKYSSRKYERTNDLGIERFSNYGEKIKSKLKDGWLILWAIFFIVFGLANLTLNHEQSWGWVVLIPIAALFFGIWIPKRW